MAEYRRLRPARFRKYSPAIREDLISPLYHAARAAGVPMTAYVSAVLATHLTEHGPTPAAATQEPKQ